MCTRRNLYAALLSLFLPNHIIKGGLSISYDTEGIFLCPSYAGSSIMKNDNPYSFDW